MARYERDPRATPGAPPTPDGSPQKVTMVLGADGTFHAVTPPRDLKTETEAKPKPSPADDPRGAFERSAPPFGPIG